MNAIGWTVLQEMEPLMNSLLLPQSLVFFWRLFSYDQRIYGVLRNKDNT